MAFGNYLRLRTRFGQIGLTVGHPLIDVRLPVADRISNPLFTVLRDLVGLNQLSGSTTTEGGRVMSSNRLRR